MPKASYMTDTISPLVIENNECIASKDFLYSDALFVVPFLGEFCYSGFLETVPLHVLTQPDKSSVHKQTHYDVAGAFQSAVDIDVFPEHAGIDSHKVIYLFGG